MCIIEFLKLNMYAYAYCVLDIYLYAPACIETMPCSSASAPIAGWACISTFSLASFQLSGLTCSFLS